MGKQTDLDNRLRIAWLGEDETSTTFLDLLVRIYKALSALHPDEFPSEELKRVPNDESILLKLPMEERSILRQALGLAI